MKILAVHPSALMYTRIYLQLEPLGLELVAQALRKAGHEVRLVDLQTEDHKAYLAALTSWQPEVIGFGCNYLANIPEIVDLAKLAKQKLPNSFVFVGGHSASFTGEEILEHAAGAVDCVLKGEGEVDAVRLMEAVEHDRGALDRVPGAISAAGYGPPPIFVESLDNLRPARDLLRFPRKYFIGLLDPAASIEFSRGCPWDCNFCSAWTFYGRSYRIKDPQNIVEELESIRQPGVFIVDDVAFIQENQGYAIGEAIMRRGIKKKYYLETRCDVFLRNQDVFKFWRSVGLEYMFLGLEAIDSEGLEKFRKRVSVSKNLEALERARAMGITVAVNLIVDPSWDHERFEAVRQWCRETPELINYAVLTPYPGTETWHTEARRLITRDYRLFDLQHCVLPTQMPLDEFYQELIDTYANMYEKIDDWRGVLPMAPTVLRNLLHGQTNFLRIFWEFKNTYNTKRLLADHARPVNYEIRLPPPPVETIDPKMLYIHNARGKHGRALDEASEQFVDASRMGASV